MSKRKDVSKYKLCEQHRNRKYYPQRICCACSRALIDYQQNMALVELFPRLYDGRYNA